jgi:hypothetical protein
MSDIDVELRVKGGTDFSDRYLPKTRVDLVENLLDQDGKFVGTLFPDWITGARRYAGDISAATTTATLWTTLSALLNTGETGGGKYFVVTAGSAVITVSTNHFLRVGEEDWTSGNITLETEDVLMLDKVVEDGGGAGVDYYYWVVINNKYQIGTDALHGILRLSSATNSTSGVSSGIAATPAAVKAAYDLAASKDNYGFFQFSTNGIDYAEIGPQEGLDIIFNNLQFNLAGSDSNLGQGNGAGVQISLKYAGSGGLYGSDDEPARHDHSHDFDKYVGWNLFVNAVKKLDVATEGNVDFTEGEGIDISYSGGVITISAENASTTNKGVVEMASQQEVMAGTAQDKVVSPMDMFSYALPVYGSLARANADAPYFPTGKIVLVEV